MFALGEPPFDKAQDRRTRENTRQEIPLGVRFSMGERNGAPENSQHCPYWTKVQYPDRFPF
jgi:hypothetical protein